MNNKKIKKIITFLLILSMLIFGYSVFSLFFFNSEKFYVPYNSFVEMIDKGSLKDVKVNKQKSKIYFSKNNSNILFKNKYYTTYPATEDFIEILLKKDVKVSVAKNTDTSSYISTAISLGFLVGFLIYMKNFENGDMETNPVEDNKLTFDDVAGMNELKHDLSFIAEMMKNKDYKKAGAKIPKGILLEGPPGNGKTLISRAFAGEAGVNFIAVNACDFGSKYIGVGTLKINKIFKNAKENSPCVLFIDEIDAIGAKRISEGGASANEYNTILTALLNNMDGFDQNTDVLVLAATNRADDLDPALLRPGRFDKKFVVAPPDKLTRKELFKFATKDVNVNADVSYDELSKKTYGCSSSEITTIVNEAIINSVKNHHKDVQICDFEKAILETELKGHLKEEYEQTEREKKITAYHEAGHAVISYVYCNKRVSNITIRPTTSGAGGFTITENSGEDLMPIMDIKNRIVMCYGGRAAESVLLGSVEMASAGASQDVIEATKMAKNYVLIRDGIDYTQLGEKGQNETATQTLALLRECSGKAKQLISGNWDLVSKIANKLLEQETITETEFEDLVKDYSSYC